MNDLSDSYGLIMKQVGDFDSRFFDSSKFKPIN